VGEVGQGAQRKILAIEAEIVTVDLWSFESQIYPKIDAEGIQGKKSLRVKFKNLGEGNKAEVRINVLVKVPSVRESCRNEDLGERIYRSRWLVSEAYR
jgi:hypothetical protein